MTPSDFPPGFNIWEQVNDSSWKIRLELANEVDHLLDGDRARLDDCVRLTPFHVREFRTRLNAWASFVPRIESVCEKLRHYCNEMLALDLGRDAERETWEKLSGLLWETGELYSILEHQLSQQWPREGAASVEIKPAEEPGPDGLDSSARELHSRLLSEVDLSSLRRTLATRVTRIYDDLTQGDPECLNSDQWERFIEPFECYAVERFKALAALARARVEDGEAYQGFLEVAVLSVIEDILPKSQLVGKLQFLNSLERLVDPDRYVELSWPEKGSQPPKLVWRDLAERDRLRNSDESSEEWGLWESFAPKQVCYELRWKEKALALGDRLACELLLRIQNAVSEWTPQPEAASTASIEARPAEPCGREDFDLQTAEGRQAAVKTYIDLVFTETGERIGKSQIWRAAGYPKYFRECQRWQNNDPKTPRTTHEYICRVLFDDRPHLRDPTLGKKSRET